MVRMVPLERLGEVKQFFVQELNFVFYFRNINSNFLSKSYSSPKQKFSIQVL